MAKGRRYGPERLLGTCGYASTHLIAGPEYNESDMGTDSTEPESDRTGSAPLREYNRNKGGLSMVFSGGSTERRRPTERRHVAVANSVPVNIPDWTRFRGNEVEAEVESSDESSEWVAPHVYLAKSGHMRTGVTSSVFHGVGRTLKGRDMSRVRDAVWNQTGFFG